MGWGVPEARWQCYNSSMNSDLSGTRTTTRHNMPFLGRTLCRGPTNIRPQLLWVAARDVEAVWIWRGEWDFPASPPWKPIPCEPGLRLKLSFWNLKSYNQVPRPHRRTSGMSLHPEVTHPWTLKICIFYELIYYDALHNVTNLSFYLDMIHILTVLIQRYSSFLQ